MLLFYINKYLIKAAGNPFQNVFSVETLNILIASSANLDIQDNNGETAAIRGCIYTSIVENLTQITVFM